jgi:hypothetical protein
MIGYQPGQQSPPMETLGLVSRRESILALVGLCAGMLAGAPSGTGEVVPDCGTLDDWLRHHGANFFSDVAALRRLGAVYLIAHPEERSRRLLSHLLIDGGDGTIPARLLRALDKDWSNHHVAVVDGWLLARTEARLCAVLHLQEGART